jgi:hypothetical protein
MRALSPSPPFFMPPHALVCFLLLATAAGWSPSPVDSSVYDRGLVDEKLK